MRELAAIAAKTTRADGSALGENPAPDDLAAVEENLAVRKASEELSALIIGAKRRNVIWADIDEACGYKRGSAGAQASRTAMVRCRRRCAAIRPPAPGAFERLAEDRSAR
ncbi:hypothetical protein [Arthrobacter sp. VKM Ac-2550]|uniref:hypothetical protein n=1 Tax=Crystallibacter permensis TaxID=1938888 RepID=UPI002227345F|nr:hypothetical protein [Arthrobacter sp. VKM Ac-2550]MCW2135153.1 hypothetical protein [Arthrobacter sp. VKM Ac-2550]